jgi:hypothetical protein
MDITGLSGALDTASAPGAETGAVAVLAVAVLKATVDPRLPEANP